jgi:hypothetical protein
MWKFNKFFAPRPNPSATHSSINKFFFAECIRTISEEVFIFSEVFAEYRIGKDLSAKKRQ